MSSKTLLQVNYEKHASYNFNDVQELSESKIINSVELFNSEYDKMVLNETSNSKEGLEGLSRKLHSALENIFSNLINLSGDQFQNQFYQELKKFSTDLLGEDLKNYSRSFKKIECKKYWKKNSNKLHTDKFFISKVDSKIVSKILDISKPEIDQFWKNVADGKTSRENLSVNCGKTVKTVVKIINKEYKRLGILEAVSSYRGESIYVSGCAIELSVDKATWWKKTYAEYPEDTKVAYHHFDEGLANPKSILYLTDADITCGATSAIPHAFESQEIKPLQFLIGRAIGHVGANKNSELYSYYREDGNVSFVPKNKRKHFMSLPKKLRFNSHFGFDVIPGSEQENNLLESEVSIIGSAGTCLVFDGAKLLHRGGLVMQGHRIALQIILARKQSFFERIKRKFKL